MGLLLAYPGSLALFANTPPPPPPLMCRLLLGAGNKFLQDYKPWESIKTDKELCGSYLAACMGLVALLAALVEPYMPSVTKKVKPMLLSKPELPSVSHEVNICRCQNPVMHPGVYPPPPPW